MKLPLLSLYFLLALPLIGEELNLRAPNAAFDFVDQKNGVGNSCGPASLLNSFGAGSQSWQDTFQKVSGSDDRARISSVIRWWGLAPSANIRGRKRWERKGGCNFVDLTAMAQEMRALTWGLPKVKSELYFADPGRESEANLVKAHKHLRKSFKKGLPPILSVRRFVMRDGQWQGIHGHFVVLTAMPEKLARGSKTFAIEFVDPIGAKSYRGEIRAPDATASLPSLVLVCPTSTVGKAEVKKGERSALGLTGAIGAW